MGSNSRCLKLAKRPLKSKSCPCQLPSKRLECVTCNHLAAALKQILRFCFCSCSNCRRAPNSRSCPDNASRIGKLWHVASLSFAANPVRAHREWAGVIDRVNLPEPEVPQTASPGVGAIIRCLHRDFHPSNDHGRYAHSPAVASLSTTLLSSVVASVGPCFSTVLPLCTAHCTMAHP